MRQREAAGVEAQLEPEPIERALRQGLDVGPRGRSGARRELAQLGSQPSVGEPRFVAELEPAARVQRAAPRYVRTHAERRERTGQVAHLGAQLERDALAREARAARHVRLQYGVRAREPCA
jgi:hypothetical protein